MPTPLWGRCECPWPRKRSMLRAGVCNLALRSLRGGSRAGSKRQCGAGSGVQRCVHNHRMLFIRWRNDHAGLRSLKAKQRGNNNWSFPRLFRYRYDVADPKGSLPADATAVRPCSFYLPRAVLSCSFSRESRDASSRPTNACHRLPRSWHAIIGRLLPAWEIRRCVMLGAGHSCWSFGHGSVWRRVSSASPSPPADRPGYQPRPPAQAGSAQCCKYASLRQKRNAAAAV